MKRWFARSISLWALFVVVTSMLVTCVEASDAHGVDGVEGGKSRQKMVHNKVLEQTQQQEEQKVDAQHRVYNSHFKSTEFSGTHTSPDAGEKENETVHALKNKSKNKSNQSNNKSSVNSDSSIKSNKNTTHDTSWQYIQLSPSSQQFRERPVCIPTVEVVEIKNVAENEDLILLDTESLSPHIQRVYFANSTIPPLSSTNLSVVFLPRVLGPVEGTFSLHTSFGNLTYSFSGSGIPSPYRLRPLIGAKIAHNSVYSIPITIYNPHARALHITDITTSNTSLHLEHRGDQDQKWNIPSHESRVVTYLTFASTYLGKHTGYVTVKTDKELFAIPVDITVVSDGVHHVPEDTIDFGTLVSFNSSVNVPLTLLNAGSSAVRVEKIYVRDEDPNINVTGITTVIPPRSEVSIATLVYTARAKVDNRIGIISIRTNETKNRIEVKYRGRVVIGAVTFPKANTLMHIGSPPFKPVLQQLLLANTFPVPIAIYSVTTGDKKLRVMDFPPGQLAQADSTWPPLTIRYLPDNRETSFSTSLYVTTNFTTHVIPIHIFHGRLQCTFYGTSYLCPQMPNFVGDESTSTKPVDKLSVSDEVQHQSPREETYVLSFSEEVNTKSINLTNTNPTAISVLEVNSDINEIGVYLESLWSASGTSVALGSLKGISLTSKAVPKQPNAEEILLLEPGFSAIINIDLTRCSERKQGRILLRTQYFTMEFLVAFPPASGGVVFNPSILQFGEMFPGQISAIPVYARSSYIGSLRLISVSSMDPRIFTDLTNNTLQVNTDILVGTVYLDLSKAERSDTSKLSGPGEPLNKYDIATYKQYTAVKPTEVQASLLFTSDLITSHPINVVASISQPKPLPADIDFGTIHIGSQASSYIPFYNPTSTPVWVQLVPPEQSIVGDFEEDGEAEASHVYHFGPEALEVVLVEPHSTVQLGPVVFLPKDQASVSHTLFVKNNLSIVASTHLHGCGGIGKLEFISGNDVHSQLVFSVPPDKLAEGCQPGVVDSYSFEVTHEFDVVNIGTAKVVVENVGISGKPCSGYGFTVHNCTQFTLNHGEQLSLSVTYKPDFSSSLVQRDLYLYTNQGFISLPLIANIPHEHLARCNSIQQTRNNEQDETLRIVVLAMLGILFAVLAVLTLREYRDLRSRDAATLPLSKPQQLHNGGSTFNEVDPLLAQLPELDISTQNVSFPSEYLDKYTRLTYDGYRPRKKSSPPMVTTNRPRNNTSGINDKKPASMHHIPKSHEVANPDNNGKSAESSSTFAPIHPHNAQASNSPVLHKPTVNRSNTRAAQTPEPAVTHSAVSASISAVAIALEHEGVGTKKRSNSVAAEEESSSMSTKKRTSSDPSASNPKSAANKSAEASRKKKGLESQQPQPLQQAIAKRVVQPTVHVTPGPVPTTAANTTSSVDERVHMESDKKSSGKKQPNPTFAETGVNLATQQPSPKSAKRAFPPAPPPPPPSQRKIDVQQATDAASVTNLPYRGNVAPVGKGVSASATTAVVVGPPGAAMVKSASGSYIDQKKRGRDLNIHRRDLVKAGSITLPPNMAFVPKKRPATPNTPNSSPSPNTSANASPISPISPLAPLFATIAPPNAHPFMPSTMFSNTGNNDREYRGVATTLNGHFNNEVPSYIPPAPPSPQWGVQWKRAAIDPRQVHPGMQAFMLDGTPSTPLDGSPHSLLPSGDTVGSLGGVTLSNSMEVKQQQRKDTIGVIGSGKTGLSPMSSLLSSPSSPAGQAQSNVKTSPSSLLGLPFQPLHTVTSAELFSFYSPLSSHSTESSFFSNSAQHSSYYFSTPTKTSPHASASSPLSSPTLLHHSGASSASPDIATTSPSYELFASAPFFKKRSSSSADSSPSAQQGVVLGVSVGVGEIGGERETSPSSFFDFSLLDPLENGLGDDEDDQTGDF